jgi:hypothetical protein
MLAFAKHFVKFLFSKKQKNHFLDEVLKIVVVEVNGF